MIDVSDIDTIRSKVDDYWRKILESDSANFIKIASGKEGGHQLSDRVDQLTTSFVHASYPLRSGFQHTNGKTNSRSMGDIWFKNQHGEWSPINIKTGLVGSEGQPNIVSLKRVMTSIFEHRIDSYYLLFVKFELGHEGTSISHRTHLIDLLDWIVLPRAKSVVTFNAGPGQMMLKAERFFELLGKGFSPDRHPIRDKAKALMALYLLGEKNLMRDRRKDRIAYKATYEEFMRESEPFAIDTEKQLEFDIQ